MILKKKSWVWKLTYPFAHKNYTTIGNTIYCPSDIKDISLNILEHEKIHIEQQKAIGVFKYVFLYLFVFPFLWNPFRFRWEFVAYIDGSKLSREDTLKILRSSAYGWLRNGVD